MFEHDLVQLDFEFLGDQHRQRRVGALSHFHIGHCERDRPTWRDPDEGTGRELFLRRRRGRRECWQRHAEQKTAATRNARFEDAAP